MTDWAFVDRIENGRGAMERDFVNVIIQHFAKHDYARLELIAIPVDWIVNFNVQLI